MRAYIVIILIALALASCSADWEINTMPMITRQHVPEEEKAPNPVPGTPYKVPLLPAGRVYPDDPNPLLPTREYSAALAPRAIIVQAY